MPKFSSGFTLVELLVVISIIAVLSIIGITLFTNVQKGARDSKRVSDLDSIVKALEIYKSTNGFYPSGGCGAINGNSALVSALANSFASGSIPNDPNPGAVGNYNYTYCQCPPLPAAADQFLICSALEIPAGKANHRNGNGSVCNSTWYVAPGNNSNDRYCVHSSL